MTPTTAIVESSFRNTKRNTFDDSWLGQMAGELSSRLNNGEIDPPKCPVFRPQNRILLREKSPKYRSASAMELIEATSLQPPALEIYFPPWISCQQGNKASSKIVVPRSSRSPELLFAYKCHRSKPRARRFSRHNFSRGVA